MSQEAFPFLSLPGEVRNMIYRCALVARDHVSILDMHPDQYSSLQHPTRRFRRPYRSAKTVFPVKADLQCSCRDEACACHSDRSTPESFTTIYTRDADRNSDLSPALLRTSKEIRREAHWIFYQENTFFYSMSAVMPFLTDRTPESLVSIKSIGFHLAIDHYAERDPIYLNWVCVFREVSCKAGLKLQNLSLEIHSRKYAPCYTGRWAAGGLDWVYSITRITGLQGLHIEFDLGSTENPGTEERERYLAAENVNAHYLWCWLAPRMLTDRAGAIEKAAAYLKSKESAREAGCLFVLYGVKGGEMVWDLQKARR